MCKSKQLKEAMAIPTDDYNRWLEAVMPLCEDELLLKVADMAAEVESGVFASHHGNIKIGNKKVRKLIMRCAVENWLCMQFHKKNQKRKSKQHAAEYHRLSGAMCGDGFTTEEKSKAYDVLD